MLYPSPHMYPCGDHAITVELGDEINIGLNQKIISLFTYLKKNPPEGLQDLIPAYHTLTLVYDTVLLKKKYSSAYDYMCFYLEQTMQKLTAKNTMSNTVDLPVCYDELLAPDLVSLAALHLMSKEEAIQLHTSKIYHVYMIGFLPGFAYMGSVDEKIRTSRKSNPRTVVAAGSVGIAGEQTGIYPFDSPGGWQLIGQTPVKMFDAKKEDPCYLHPGDAVRFYSISFDEFTKMKKA